MFIYESLFTKMKLKKLCRLCAKEHATLIDVYGQEGVRLNLLSKLVQCLHIWITPEDKLPTTMCHTCCLRLNDSAQFITDSLQAQSELQALLATDSPHQETPVEVKQNEKHELLVEEELVDMERGAEEGDEDEDERCEDDDVAEDGVEEQEDDGVVNGVAEAGETAVSQDSQDSRDSGLLLPSARGLVQCILQDAPVHHKAEVRTRPRRRAATVDGSRKKKLRPKLESWYGTWQCSECPAVLRSSDQLQAHYEMEHPAQAVRYQCVDCSRVYSNCRKLARHVRVHWNKGRFKCEQCPKSFSTRQNLTHHAILHKEDQPWACGLCDKKFRHASSLNFHRVVHLSSSECKFSCCECGRNFLSNYKLEVHMKIHAGTREHTCHLCGKSFTVKQSLIAHMTTHNEGRPHVCPQCGAGFKTPYSLRHHTLIHTGVKPHQCDVCGKQFRGKSALRQHGRIHTGAMPYSCDICGRKFRFQGVFVIHRRQHTGERPYKCAHCTREFVSWANYNKHVKCRHTSTGPSIPPPELSLPLSRCGVPP